MIDRLAGALGVDAVQWRALVRTYLRMDFRATGGPSRRRGPERGRSQMLAIAIAGAIGGVLFAFVAATMADVLMSAAILIMILITFRTRVKIRPKEETPLETVGV